VFLSNDCSCNTAALDLLCVLYEDDLSSFERAYRSSRKLLDLDTVDTYTDVWHELALEDVFVGQDDVAVWTIEVHFGSAIRQNVLVETSNARDCCEFLHAI
jgi:hypothetical protein